jgi:hypothetical protein
MVLILLLIILAYFAIWHSVELALAAPVCTENLDPNIMVMKPAKDRA